MRRIDFPPEKIDELIRLYGEGWDSRRLQTHFGYARRCIIRTLEANGVVLRTLSEARRKYAVDESYFNVIDTEEKAYWLGFLATDGYIHKNGQAVVLRLQRKDRGHVEKFRDALRAEHTIYDLSVKMSDKTLPNLRGRTFLSSGITITSERLVHALGCHGVHTCKSHTVCPWEGPDHLMASYWRGCLDGDGWIGKNKVERVWSLGFCGNAAMVQGFANFMEVCVDVPAALKEIKGGWRVSYSCVAKQQKIVGLLYGGATVFLDRKKELADRLLAQEMLRKDWLHLTLADLQALRAEHGTWGAVASHLGTRRAWVMQLLRRLGAPKERKDWAWLTPEKLHALREEHGAWLAVARALGIDPAQLFRVRQQRGT